jgi:glycosyltransferase involved in cell wall biosynthesis
LPIVSLAPRVVRNDWSPVAVPAVDGWRPTLAVTVVIPAYQCQSTLDLTLASLRHQTYPADLLEVVVVDDGSDPPLTLPPIRPERTALLRVPSGWGQGNARHHGATHSHGEILLWLDADMVVHPEHIAAQARWHHALPYAVTLGYKRFVDRDTREPWPSPVEVATLAASGAIGGLFDGGAPHGYVERYITQTDGLRTADHLAFKIHTGATAAVRRELYAASGGFDTDLRLGEDTELGYRLAQAGAVFVPEPRALAWHLGRSQVQRARERVTRYSRPFIADRVPVPRHWRRTGGPTWTVPLVEVVLRVTGEPLERVRTAVDAVLRGTEHDVRVTLVGPWHTLDGARVAVLADPRQDLRIIAATYKAEPRVRLAAEPPDTAFPAPYLLDLPAPLVLPRDGLRRLIDVADRHRVGALRVDPPDGAGPPLVLWRTAALSRARWVRAEGEPLLDAVAAVHGSRDVDAATAGLSQGRRPAGLTPSMVEVEGVRSLARAAIVVARLGGRRLTSWLRRLSARSRSTRLSPGGTSHT